MAEPGGGYRDLLVTYLGPQWRRAILLGLLLLSSIALDLTNPQILRYFIDSVRSGTALHTLTLVAVLFLVVALATQVVSVAEIYLAENVGWTATNRLRADLALHCLRLDPSFHHAHTPGELIERIDGDVHLLSNFFSRFVVHLLGNALLLIGVLVLLFRIDWRVGAALTGLSMCSVLLINSLRNIGVPHRVAARQANAELYGFLEERISGTEDIRASGATAYVMRQLYERSRNVLRKERIAALIGGLSWHTTTFLFTICTAAALVLAAYRYQAHAISLGSVYLIFAYTQLLSRPIEQITRQMQDLQLATASIGRIQQLFALQSVIADGRGDRLPAGALSVELQDVVFGYGDNQPVLREVSFRLAPGQVLGVLGRTGSGKSTLTRLLFRLYDPASGAIRLGEVDLRALELAHLRGRVGMVTQEIHLFHASVRDNLTLFDRTIRDERIVQVLLDLGLEEWYRALPRGLDSMLAAGGGISAGEAQLLAFARVFLEDPGLVILDEASSRLDPATERRIEHAVHRLLAGRTGIIIAHRLATVLRADAILVLQEGRIVEYGPRETLARDPRTHFAHLLHVGQRAGVTTAPTQPGQIEELLA